MARPRHTHAQIIQKERKDRKAILLKELKKTYGLITEACENLNVSRSTYYTYYNNDPEFAAQVDHIKESKTDFYETQLMKQAKQGNAASTIFYLKTQARDRGFIENPVAEEHLKALTDIKPNDKIKEVKEYFDKHIINVTPKTNTPETPQSTTTTTIQSTTQPNNINTQ